MLDANVGSSFSVLSDPEGLIAVEWPEDQEIPLGTIDSYTLQDMLAAELEATEN